MKKLFIAFIALSITLAGCSNDDENTVPFTSQIKIDGKDFSPTPDKNGIYVTTTFYASTGENSENSRIFFLQKGIDVNTEQLAVAVRYANGETIDGTYLFGVNDGFGSRLGNGTYTTIADMFDFSQGSVTVTDLGGSKYKLVFNDVNALSVLLAEGETNNNITITGFFEGKFLELPIEE